jgi:hypothetical protein
MPKIHYKPEEILGNRGIVFIEETDPEYQSGHNLRRAKFRCNCGNLFEARISAVKIDHTSCGCIKREKDIKRHLTHGMYGTSSYTKWGDIRERTGNPNSNNYKDYGGRGITMFPPWREDFQLFYDYVSALPHFGEKGLTLDRINNDGNYEPGNLRWATQHIQSTNSRIQKNNTSGYKGISFIKKENRWVATIKVMGKSIYIGQFKAKEQAVIARNNYIVANGLFEYKIQPIKNQ